jgi:transcription antitermination factor NusG
MNPRWVVATYRRGKEVPAAAELDETSGGDPSPFGRRAFCPVERDTTVRRRRPVVSFRPVISGYVFVEDVDDDRWHAAAAIDGFLGFLGPDGLPSPVLGDGLRLLEALLASAVSDEDGRRVIEWPLADAALEPYERGDLVRFRTDLDSLDALPMSARLVVEGAPASVGVVEWVGRPGTVMVSFRGLFASVDRIELPTTILCSVEDEVGSSKERRRTLYDAVGLHGSFSRP